MSRTIRLAQRHVERWGGCIACPIGERATKHVFYRGDLPCDILFVGEAPGEMEDRYGMPFVGRSGSLLDELILPVKEAGVRWCITNICACRPTEPETPTVNRPPTPSEIANCTPRLIEMIGIARPRMLITLGNTAADNLPSSIYERPSSELLIRRLKHPAYALRQGGVKSKAFKLMRTDLNTFVKELLEEQHAR